MTAFCEFISLGVLGDESMSKSRTLHAFFVLVGWNCNDYQIIALCSTSSLAGRCRAKEGIINLDQTCQLITQTVLLSPNSSSRFISLIETPVFDVAILKMSLNHFSSGVLVW